MFFSALGSKKAGKVVGAIAINSPENKKRNCCSVGVAPSVKTTELLPSGSFIV